MAGMTAVRFCFFNPRGRFQRSPLMINEKELGEMREALEQTPRLRELLKKLVADLSLDKMALEEVLKKI